MQDDGNDNDDDNLLIMSEDPGPYDVLEWYVDNPIFMCGSEYRTSNSLKMCLKVPTLQEFYLLQGVAS